ncbi:hypothetical protein PUN28_018347 [Cardiocondyla obscurior]|uniref:Uncharacterized protein n=1 Tax=Cardiocondyla obscurior TaxID=286306 RepID=A0AAW2EL66_9HYME
MLYCKNERKYLLHASFNSHSSLKSFFFLSRICFIYIFLITNNSIIFYSISCRDYIRYRICLITIKMHNRKKKKKHETLIVSCHSISKLAEENAAV